MTAYLLRCCCCCCCCCWLFGICNMIVRLKYSFICIEQHWTYRMSCWQTRLDNMRCLDGNGGSLIVLSKHIGKESGCGGGMGRLIMTDLGFQHQHGERVQCSAVSSHQLALARSSAIGSLLTDWFPGWLAWFSWCFRGDEWELVAT